MTEPPSGLMTVIVTGPAACRAVTLIESVRTSPCRMPKRPSRRLEVAPLSVTDAARRRSARRRHARDHRVGYRRPRSCSERRRSGSAAVGMVSVTATTPALVADRSAHESVTAVTVPDASDEDRRPARSPSRAVIVVPPVVGPLTASPRDLADARQVSKSRPPHLVGVPALRVGGIERADREVVGAVREV